MTLLLIVYLLIPCAFIVAGDLAGFLENYPDASLRIVKVSDE